MRRKSRTYSNASHKQLNNRSVWRANASREGFLLAVAVWGVRSSNLFGRANAHENATHRRGGVDCRAMPVCATTCYGFGAGPLLACRASIASITVFRAWVSGRRRNENCFAQRATAWSDPNSESGAVRRAPDATRGRRQGVFCESRG
jgi:hypothetical protein